MADHGLFRVTLEERHVDAYGGHREDEPRQGADERHKELSQVVVGLVLIAHKMLGLESNLVDLGHVMLLMCPDLLGELVLFVHHADALEVAGFYLERTELFLETFEQLVAIDFFSRTF